MSGSLITFTSRSSPEFPLITGGDGGKRPDAAAGSVAGRAEFARLGIPTFYIDQ
jgi:hypothetical protein